jgi:lysophospholipase L1-like esterase
MARHDYPIHGPKGPFSKFVIMGESTVEGGDWLPSRSQRFADVLAKLLNLCQEQPPVYVNKGIGANAISPRSPGYEASAKPSALERYKDDVIAEAPDLFVLCYGLNDMRAAMPLDGFLKDMRKIIRDVRKACDPLIVLTTVYYMNGWKSYPPFDRGSVELTEAYNDGIRGLARKAGCVLADVWDAEGQADWLIHPDGVHANTVGNRIIAHRIFEAIAHNAPGLTDLAHKECDGTEWTTGTTGAREGGGDPFVKTW